MKLFDNAGKLWIVFLAISLVMAGCGGGSGGGTSGDPALRMGVFLDSAVEGLNYKTATQSGVTEVGGIFWYREGETVAFSIGETLIGQTAGKAQITPVDLVTGASDETDPKVTNICRLLQSLDRDGIPENGIQISQQIQDVIKKHPVDLNLSTAGFETSPAITNLLGELNGAGAFTDKSERVLPTAEQARTHFRETMRTFSSGPQKPSLNIFATAFELETYLKQQYAFWLLSPSTYHAYTGPPATGDYSLTTGSADATGTTSEHSGTNIQEPGVDESDKVKTDGTYLYIAGNGKVIIVQAVPAETMSKISTVVINGTVDSLYLHNKMLVALYTVDRVSGWDRFTVQTGVMLIDVTEPANPQVKKDVVIDGSFVSSRLIGGKLHLIQRSVSKHLSFKGWYDGTERDLSYTMAANLKALSSLSLKDFVPSIQITDDQGRRTEPISLALPNFYLSINHMNQLGSGGRVTITTLDLNDATFPWQNVGTAVGAETVYVARESLYLASWRWNDTTGRHETVIHKFDLTGDKAQSMDSGSVPGFLLDQFSLGEYEGVLRVATNGFARSGTVPTSANHIYCLKSGTGGLEVIGKLENLAPGERIYAARFIGKRGFLVTFEFVYASAYARVDPLLALDLSDPTAPRAVGELEVPGYSDYIHPLGENHLLAIGKDIKIENGTTWYQGVQLSLFDITDFANPSLLHKELIGVRGTESEALHDHKAFTFWKEKNLLALPIRLYEYQKPPAAASEFGTKTFVGLYGYRVNPDKGFELLGRIPAVTNTITYTANPYYQYPWMRSLFIGDWVYAVQPGGVSSAQINNIAGTVKQITIDN